jgi:hypothetical protein
LVILPQALMRLLLLVCELYSCFDALVIATWCDFCCMFDASSTGFLMQVLLDFWRRFYF